MSQVDVDAELRDLREAHAQYVATVAELFSAERRAVEHEVMRDLCQLLIDLLDATEQTDAMYAIQVGLSEMVAYARAHGLNVE